MFTEREYKGKVKVRSKETFGDALNISSAKVRNWREREIEIRSARKIEGSLPYTIAVDLTSDETCHRRKAELQSRKRIAEESV